MNISHWVQYSHDDNTAIHTTSVKRHHNWLPHLLAAIPDDCVKRQVLSSSPVRQHHVAALLSYFHVGSKSSDSATGHRRLIAHTDVYKNITHLQPHNLLHGLLHLTAQKLQKIKLQNTFEIKKISHCHENQHIWYKKSAPITLHAITFSYLSRAWWDGVKCFGLSQENTQVWNKWVAIKPLCKWRWKSVAQKHIPFVLLWGGEDQTQLS